MITRIFYNLQMVGLLLFMIAQDSFWLLMAIVTGLTIGVFGVLSIGHLLLAWLS